MKTYSLKLIAYSSAGLIIEKIKRMITVSFMIIALLFSIIEYGDCYKIHPNAGETSAAFLKIPPGGRSVSMGESGVSLYSDVFGMWWNPASISMIRRKTVGASYNRWFQDMSVSFAGGVFPIFKNENLGFMVDGLVIKDNIERRSGEGEDDPYFPVSSPEGEFGAYDLMIGGVYSRRLSRNMYAGVTLKGIMQNIDDEDAYAMGVDAGVIYSGIRLFNRDISIGAAVRNFGTAVRFREEAFNLPLDYTLGAGVNPVRNLLISLDLQQAVDNYLKIHGGAEYKVFNKLLVRSGYVYRLTGNPLGGFSGFRGGFGVQLGDFTVDYSYAPYSYLGESHRISIQVLFGGVSEKKRKIEPEERKKSEKKEVPYLTAMMIKPLSIGPDGVIWSVGYEKELGVLRKLDMITSQQEVEGAEFEVIESSSVPEGFGLPEGYELVKHIILKHGIDPATISRSIMEISLGGDIREVTVIDREHRDVPFKKMKADRYSIEKVVEEIFILNKKNR